MSNSCRDPDKLAKQLSTLSMMTLRGKKQILWFLSLAVLAAALWILFWGLSELVLSDQGSEASPSLNRTQHTKKGTDRNLSKSDFEAVWNQPLRQPLYDPPPLPPKPVEKKPPPPIRAKLLATMIESENSQAMIELANGEVVFRKSGDLLGGENGEAIISEIRPGTVLIRQGEAETTLTVDTGGRR